MPGGVVLPKASHDGSRYLAQRGLLAQLDQAGLSAVEEEVVQGVFTTNLHADGTFVATRQRRDQFRSGASYE